MAKQRLRPGTYQATEDNTAVDKIQIDHTWWEIPRNGTIDFDVKIIATYDDAHITVYRVPPKPRTVTSNVGS